MSMGSNGALPPGAKVQPKQVYVDQMFNLGGAAVTSLTAMNPGTTSAAGAYSPLADGYLKTVTIEVSPQAATSLAQSGYITLNATSFAPINTMTIPFTGFGLATAPQAVGGNTFVTTWDGLWLPIKSAVKINGNVIYLYSPVTPNITVTGTFVAT